MKFLAGLFCATMTSFLIALGATSQAIAPMLTVAEVVSVSANTIATTTTTTVASLVVDADAKCGQWWSVAVAAGWDENDLRDLDGVLFRESRCDATQVNASDPNTVDEFNGEVSSSQLLDLTDTYRKWRDMSYIAFGLVYILNVVDANVDAHFVRFDVSRDLTVGLGPSMQTASLGAPGLSLAMTFR